MSAAPSHLTSLIYLIDLGGEGGKELNDGSQKTIPEKGKKGGDLPFHGSHMRGGGKESRETAGKKKKERARLYPLIN